MNPVLSKPISIIFPITFTRFVFLCHSLELFQYYICYSDLWSMIFDVTILIVLWWTIRKVMTNLDSMLKSRDITLPTKVHLVKAMVFPMVMYGCEIWTVKKAECWRIDAFELCGIGEDSWESLGVQGYPTSPFWRRSVLGVPCKDWCWSWNSNTLATLWKSWFFGKDPDAGSCWGQEEKGPTQDEMAEWHHVLDGHESE